MRLIDLVGETGDELERAGVPDPLVDAEILVLHAAQIERLAAYMENPETDQALRKKVRRLADRRLAGEPVQYILGEVEFLGMPIRVGRGVLIPRPETEQLAEEIIHELAARTEPGEDGSAEDSLRLLDLCTGSGCVALAVARASMGAEVIGTDLSARALRYAEENARLNEVTNVRFLRGTLFRPVKGTGPFDIISANPPYIKKSDLVHLQREVRDWEPHRALDGGEDGLDFYRKIFSGCCNYLKKSGTVMVELGYGQAGAVSEIARENGLGVIQIRRDYAGIERILKACGGAQSPHLQG